ncbi:MAG TPA: SpoIIE family protein phosphatase [Thermosynechococcaceae cyanobacterium]
MIHSAAITVTDPSHVGDARRKAVLLAHDLGFKETDRGKVGIVITEIANNLVHHGKAGQLLLHPLERQGVSGIEILALDRGQGMLNISECLEDGFSTAGTGGNGLGAIDRLSSLLEIYSLPQKGTALLCQLWATNSLSNNLSSAGERLQIGAICLPKAGEEVSGDAWGRWRSVDDRHLLMVVDGLGHGEMAAQASAVALRALQENADRSPGDILQAIHSASRGTRGSAVAIAEVNLAAQTFQYAGVGNIAGVLAAEGRSSSLVSHHGTIGHEARKIQTFSHVWNPEGLLILHSDGLSNHWQIDRYPGLIHKQPSLIAGVLYRDFCRDRDDITVVVAREVK